MLPFININQLTLVSSYPYMFFYSKYFLNYLKIITPYQV